MTLEKLLYSSKPNYIKFVKKEKKRYKFFNKGQFLEIKGKIAEKYVNYWLKNFSNIKFPKNNIEINSSYSYNLKNNNYLFYKNNNLIFELDNLIIYNKKYYPIEVKSGKLNGFSKKIPKIIKNVKNIFDNFGYMLVFIPFRTYDKKKQFKNIEKNYKNKIKFINLDDKIKNNLK